MISYLSSGLGNDLMTLASTPLPELIDLLHKSYNAPALDPTMHHFVTEMCTQVYISVTKWCIVGYFSDALWSFCYGTIVNMDNGAIWHH